MIIPGIAFCCSTANFKLERLRVHRLLSSQRQESALCPIEMDQHLSHL
jgi:hypothetical protein